jgi:glutamyl-tRNA reductase
MQLQNALLYLQNYVPKGIILSTCNRTEVYALSYPDCSVEQAGIDFLKNRGCFLDSELEQFIYAYEDETAVKHLFQITSGLDSMIIGEFEILGQVRQALEKAEKVQKLDSPLRNLFLSAIRTGRRVREETSISKNPLSVSSVAVRLATEKFDEIRNCKVLIIGTGEAGRLVGKSLTERGVSQIVVVGRTLERAESFTSEFGGRATVLNDLETELKTADIVITCTGAPHFILNHPLVKKVMSFRPESPLVIVDIAVPRDVETEVRQIGNVFLYDIDDLTEISELNRKEREMEIQKAEEIIDEEVEIFTSWLQTLEVNPVISALVKKAEEIRQYQLNKALKKLPPLSEEEQAVLGAMTSSIVKKMLHQPIQCLKKNASRDREYIQLVEELFSLNKKDLD